MGLLVRILEEMARGNAVTSRPSLIQPRAEGKITYRKVGTHRHVRFEALMKYKRRANADRLAALEELPAYDQERVSNFTAFYDANVLLSR